jgi:hypothetical protein
MTDLTVFLVALAAAAGSLAAGLLGWMDNGGSWSWRKFGSNLIRSITSGMTVALGQEITRYTGTYLYFAAFIMGMGLDTILNRTQSSLSKNGRVTDEDLDKFIRDLNRIAKSRTEGDQTHDTSRIDTTTASSPDRRADS